MKNLSVYLVLMLALFVVHTGFAQTSSAPEGRKAAAARRNRGLSMNQVGIFLHCTGRTDPREALEAVKSLGLNMVQISKLPDRF